MANISALLRTLNGDPWRKEHDFSSDIKLAHDILFHPYTDLAEKQQAINRWFQRFQPCLFGRIAAGMGKIHYCLLTDEDLSRDDDFIQAKIQRERILWKQFGLNGETARHGFFLLAISPRIAYATPDKNLLAFCERLRELWNITTEIDQEGNDVSSDTLFLREPSTGRYVKFTLNVDLFASAGDGRWWSDHRVPGGIGFTANSIGHMVRANEWYRRKTDQDEWALATAMLTINGAENTSSGPATWLLKLEDGKPFRRESKCPFKNPDALKEQLKEKDWTTYGGFFHTDHSVRDEFFGNQEAPNTVASPWLMDLTYLFEPSDDYANLTAGQPVKEEEVYAEIGAPSTWRRMPKPKGVSRSMENHKEIRKMVAETKAWELTQEELTRIQS